MITPNKKLCDRCHKVYHEDMFDACCNCYGTFKATKNGLKKVKEKPIKITINGKTTTVRPGNPFYSTVQYYSKEVKYDPETGLEIDQEDRGVPNLSEV